MNPEKILIDTSAWIVSFKKSGDAQLKEFLLRTTVWLLGMTGLPVVSFLLFQRGS